MAGSDGDLTAFGLTFRQYDTRQMQHILRAYGQMPAAPNARTILYLALATLERTLPHDEAEAIRDWLSSGGILSDFPGPSTAQGPPVNAADLRVNVNTLAGSDVYGESDEDDSDEDYPDENMGGEYERPPIGQAVGAFYQGQSGSAGPAQPTGHRLPSPEGRFNLPERSTIRSPSGVGRDGIGGALMELGGYGGLRHQVDATGHLLPPPQGRFFISLERNTMRVDGWGGIRHQVEPTGYRLPTPQDRLDPPERNTIPVDGWGGIRHQVETIGNRLPTLQDRLDPPERNIMRVDDRGGVRHQVEPTRYRLPITRDRPTALSMALQTAIPRGTIGNERGYIGDHMVVPLHAATGDALSSESPEPHSSNVKECCLCYNFYGPEEFPESSKITVSCNHPYEEFVCLQCIQRYIQALLLEGDIHRMRCPLCPVPLTSDDIKKYSTIEMFTRYEHLVFMATPGLVMCLGLHCGRGQVHEEKADDPVMQCNSCGFKTCVVHKLPWHEGFTCEEFDGDESQVERLEADEATAKLLFENSKVCPSCNQGVTKNAGCDHLECRCGKEWCFICLAPWENIIRIGVTAHARTCVYHPDQVTVSHEETAAAARQMTELVHGGPVSEALAKARVERENTRRVAIRPLAAEAAEKRMQAQREAEGDRGGRSSGKVKTKLVPAWEEQH
ncbi:ring finger protein [Diplocarpon rosae]|nr:ring finger protein [Diplocarpon rosae]